MLLAFDIGNTDVTIGLYQDDTWKDVWRMPSDLNLADVRRAMILRDRFLERSWHEDEVERVVISSVVPDLTQRMVLLARQLYSVEPCLLGPDTFSKLPIGVLNPFQIGSDLVANALAAWHRSRGDCLVVDFGTALTFTVVEDNKIAGVAIAPGLKTSVKALSLNAARLFEVPLEMPVSVLGRGTTHAMQAGIMFGYEGLVRGIVGRVREELQKPELPVFATGGLSGAIVPLHALFTEINPNLTLDGLRLFTKYC